MMSGTGTPISQKSSALPMMSSVVCFSMAGQRFAIEKVPEETAQLRQFGSDFSRRARSRIMSSGMSSETTVENF